LRGAGSIGDSKNVYKIRKLYGSVVDSGKSLFFCSNVCFVDLDQVKNHFVHEFPVFEDGTKGNWVKSGLELDTDANSFRGGRLKLKCIASVFSVHHRSSEQQIEEEKPRSASVKAGSKDSSGNQVGLHNTGKHAWVSNSNFHSSLLTSFLYYIALFK